MFDKKLIDELNDRQQTFFIWLFNKCVSDFKVTMSNSQISKETDIPVSTIEKYLKKFDDLGLIERGIEKGYNNVFHKWETTSREIQLNSDIFDPFFIAKIRKQRIQESLELLDTPKSAISMIKAARGSK